MQKLLFYLGIFSLSSAVFAADPELDIVNCDNASDCRLSWNFTETPRTYYWVQQFDPGAKSWQSLDTPFTSTSPYETRQMPVAGGFLYRMLGCDDESATQNCLGSTVSWALQLPTNVEQIPTHVHNAEGDHIPLLVEKSADLRGQTIQYNVYLLVNTLNALGTDFDWRLLPSMTRPQMLLPGQGPESLDAQHHDTMTDSDWVQINVYGQYQGLRDHYLARAGQ